MSIQVFEDASLDEVAMIAKGKMMAAWSLVFWIGAVSAGRLLSETSKYVLYGHLWGS
jgi:hypothetical protein